MSQMGDGAHLHEHFAILWNRCFWCQVLKLFPPMIIWWHQSQHLLGIRPLPWVTFCPWHWQNFTSAAPRCCAHAKLCSVFSRSMLASNGPLHPQLLKYTQPKTERLLQQGFDLSEWFVPKGYNNKAGPW